MNKYKLEEIQKQIINCTKCSLHKTRIHPLLGDGNVNAKIVFIGEAPGYHEDRQNKAFIGASGKILDKLLMSIQLNRNDIYITNLLKCHPPQNHDPTEEEIKACIGYLFDQLKIIQPIIIVSLGRFAVQQIFNFLHLTYNSISEQHGQIFKINASYGPVIVIPMYHPATACYNPSLFDLLQKDFYILKKNISKIPNNLK